MLTFDPGPHVYTLDGAPVRSVTGFLRKVGAVNFDGIPPSILQAAQDRGMRVHQAIHYFNEHDLDVDRFMADFPGYAGYLQSWMRLMASGRLRSVFCEHRVACRAPRFAGTLDWLGLVDGQAAVIDFATGNPDDACKEWQTAAYVLGVQAWAQEPGEERLKAFVDAHAFIARYSVKLQKTGSLPTLTRYSDPKDFTEFRLIADTVNLVDAHRPKSAPWYWQHETLADVA